MPTRLKTKKGLDIQLAGQPEQIVHPGRKVKRVALLGADYAGLKPKMLVEVGQRVGLGEPLFLDKRDPDAPFTSPGTGRLVAINRGHRRVLESVVIELDETAASQTTFDIDLSEDPATTRNILLRSGAWTGIRTRPYNRVALSSSSPRSIFVTAIDTRPLAAEPGTIIAQRIREFERGIDVIRRLGDWPVYLCTAPNWSGPEFEGDAITRVEFEGAHPAGLVGTHMHHLDPVSANRVVWHIGYQDVIGIGHLFKTGRLLSERVVSIAGPSATNPRLVRTRLGADVAELMIDEVPANHPHRLISGSVLDGRAAKDALSYLGRYHNQISVIPESAPREPFSWKKWSRSGKSLTRLFTVGRNRDINAAFTTAQHGRQSAMQPTEALERVMPLDILPVPLLRALLVKDTDAAQALGCLELAEEDLALSSFVCPGKQDYARALRLNLDQIEAEG